MFLFFSLLLILCGSFVGYEAGMTCLVAAQACLLMGFIHERHVTAAGAFVFMSFLFFGMRPLHILLESDLNLFTSLFNLAVNEDMLLDGLWWASTGVWFFAFGVQVQRIIGKWKINSLTFQSSEQVFAASEEFGVSGQAANSALLLQVAALAAMMGMSGSGRSIYGSALGAYVYDLPMVLQGVQIFGVVVALERWRAGRGGLARNRFIFSLLLLASTSWLAREVTIFRGAYITPLMAAGLCFVLRYRGRVSYKWLILPLVFLLPWFRILGETRTLGNQEVKKELSEQVAEVLNPASYWRFFDSQGDMNIFDTFVAASEWIPSQRPYLMSWLYVPLHIVPRKLWPGKPERGLLQDMGYTHGAPYSPGIAGFFVGDGGRVWMLGNMLFLGGIISWMDMKILRMYPGYFKICAYGLVVVNALYLTRFFLWQYTYQLLYMLVPCWLLAKMLRTRRRHDHNVAQTEHVE